MEIGGQDKVLEVPFSKKLVASVKRWFQLQWPQMIWEQYPVPPGQKTQADVFVYRDRAAWMAWVDKGASPEHMETMVYLIFEDDALCCVTEGETVNKLDELFAVLLAETPTR